MRCAHQCRLTIRSPLRYVSDVAGGSAGPTRGKGLSPPAKGSKGAKRSQPSPSPKKHTPTEDEVEAFVTLAGRSKGNSIINKLIRALPSFDIPDADKALRMPQVAPAHPDEIPEEEEESRIHYVLHEVPGLRDFEIYSLKYDYLRGVLGFCILMAWFEYYSYEGRKNHVDKAKECVDKVAQNIEQKVDSPEFFLGGAVNTSNIKEALALFRKAVEGREGKVFVVHSPKHSGSSTAANSGMALMARQGREGGEERPFVGVLRRADSLFETWAVLADTIAASTSLEKFGERSLYDVFRKINDDGKQQVWVVDGVNDRFLSYHRQLALEIDHWEKFQRDTQRARDELQFVKSYTPAPRDFHSFLRQLGEAASDFRKGAAFVVLCSSESAADTLVAEGNRALVGRRGAFVRVKGAPFAVSGEDMGLLLKSFLESKPQQSAAQFLHDASVKSFMEQVRQPDMVPIIASEEILRQYEEHGLSPQFREALVATWLSRCSTRRREEQSWNLAFQGTHVQEQADSLAKTLQASARDPIEIACGINAFECEHFIATGRAVPKSAGRKYSKYPS